MAIVLWLPRQRARAQVDTLTVGSNTTGHTFIATINTKAVGYTAVSGDTTVTITAALLALLQACAEPEFRELAFALGSTTSKINVTGPDDGAPFTLTVSGTGTFSTTAATAPLSPSDVGDVLNYSTGALPGAGDTLVFEESAEDAKYNADALAGIALAAVVRRASHTGRIGLPPQNTNGYPEYRPTGLELDAPSITIEIGPGDAAGQVRIASVSSTAVTMLVEGDGTTAAVGDEVVHVVGLPAASELRVLGASAAVATLAGQTAAVATLTAQSATLWLGKGVTLGDATLTNCVFSLECSHTALTMLSGGSGDVRGAASCANAGLKVYAGTLRWRSTGGTGNSPVVGGGGTIDFGQAPAGVAVGGTVELNAGATWTDPVGKIGTPYNVALNRCSLRDVNLDAGLGKTLAVS